MPMQSPVQSQSVDEILASIRQAISDDEQRRGHVLTALAPPSPPSSGRAPGSIARAFVSANDDDDWHAPPDFETQNVIELAIEKAIDGVTAALAEENGHGGRGANEHLEAASASGREDRRADGRPLLSSQAGAAVAASFDDLSRTIAGLSAAEIRAIAQEALRPMLKGWLDDNLPSLVERLVREEIERVSRGR
jgi:uncharacterized protein